MLLTIGCLQRMSFSSIEIHIQICGAAGRRDHPEYGAATVPAPAGLPLFPATGVVAASGLHPVAALTLVFQVPWVVAGPVARSRSLRVSAAWLVPVRIHQPVVQLLVAVVDPAADLVPVSASIYF